MSFMLYDVNMTSLVPRLEAGLSGTYTANTHPLRHGNTLYQITIDVQQTKWWLRCVFVVILIIMWFLLHSTVSLQLFSVNTSQSIKN